MLTPEKLFEKLQKLLRQHIELTGISEETVIPILQKFQALQTPQAQEEFYYRTKEILENSWAELDLAIDSAIESADQSYQKTTQAFLDREVEQAGAELATATAELQRLGSIVQLGELGQQTTQARVYRTLDDLISPTQNPQTPPRSGINPANQSTPPPSWNGPGWVATPPAAMPNTLPNTPNPPTPVNPNNIPQSFQNNPMMPPRRPLPVQLPTTTGSMSAQTQPNNPQI